MSRLLISAFLTLISAQFVLGQYVGGVNDGASTTTACTITLAGANTFSLSAISGSTTFCDFATEQYSVSISGASQNTTIVWSVPAGASVVNGQGTNSVLVAFGNTNGNVRVDVSSPCTTIFSSLAVTSSACTFFKGGNNDGFSRTEDCASNLNGGSVFIPGPIVGSTTFCDFATESYSITVAGTNPETTYTWSVPVGATITSGQGTSTILVTFGTTAGNISVDVANACETINVLLPVSSTSCLFYAGGNNDGFSNTTDCASNLNGGSTFIPGPIVGSASFCDFATETYSISVAGATIETTYAWSVPAGATVTSGQGTNSILVTFGNTAGNVSVDVSNPCETINVALAVSPAPCLFYAGGSNDGFSTTTDCASNLNGGSTFIPGPIVGSTSFCDFATETYSISVAGSTSETTYAWSVPVGAVVTSGQGTNSILVTFGNTAGNVSVDVSNPCETINVALAVSPAPCLFYAGGSNDGFSITSDCASNLSGGSTFIPGPIVGSTTFCDFASEAYSITVAGATSETTYAWTAPPGATITSGQGTNTVLVTFGNTPGNVSVAVSNPCETINVQLAVATSSCIFYAGGNSDGFAMTLAFNIPLPIELISFEAKVVNGAVKISWTTASELNNDYFTVERSRSGESFQPLQTVKGAGTTSAQKSYQVEDNSPLIGRSYYRLSQTDYDGTTTYSNIVLIEIDERKSGIMSLYPNPIKNGQSLTLIYYSSKQGEVTLKLSDISGKVYLFQPRSIDRGENILTIDCELQANGVYILNILGDTQLETYKLLVQ